jgi:hypothetical protein
MFSTSWETPFRFNSWQEWIHPSSSKELKVCRGKKKEGERIETNLNLRLASTIPISMFLPDIWPSNLPNPELR